MFQEIIEKLCPEENGLCVRARRAREELVFLPLSQMYGYEAPRKHIEALLSFSDAIGLQLARDFFGNGLMIGFNSAFDGRHFDFEVRGARLYVRGKEAAGGEYEKNRQAIRLRLSDLRGGVYASCGDIEGLFAQYQDIWDKREEDQKNYAFAALNDGIARGVELGKGLRCYADRVRDCAKEGK